MEEPGEEEQDSPQEAEVDQEQAFDESLLDHAVRCWEAETENATRLSARVTLLLTAMAALFGLGLFRIEWYRKQGDTLRVAWPWAVWVIKGCVGLSLVCFVVAFSKLISRSTPKRPGLRLGHKVGYKAARAFLRLVQPKQPSSKPVKAARAFVRLINERRRATHVLGAQDDVWSDKRSSDAMAFAPSFFDEDPPTSRDLSRKLVFSLVYSAYLDLRRRNARKSQHLDRGQQWFTIGLVLVGLAIVLFLFVSD